MKPFSHSFTAHLVPKSFFVLISPFPSFERQTNFTTNTFSLSTFSEMVGKIDFGIWSFWRRNFISCCAREPTLCWTKWKIHSFPEEEKADKGKREERNENIFPGSLARRDSNLKQEGRLRCEKIETKKITSSFYRWHLIKHDELFNFSMFILISHQSWKES